MTITPTRVPPVPVQPSTATVDAARLRRRELSAFLRSRRERILPEEVGLPPGRRRRTPGLRREEVAQLAGVGVTWYTWLEQGRAIQPSEQVLGAIAATLRLDPYERSHLFTLAGLAEPLPPKECTVISPEIRLMLRQLEPFPACVKNARGDFLAFNRVFDRMVGGLSARPFEERNSVLLAFTDPSWRARIVDWPDKAPRMVAQLRAAMAQHMAEPSWKCLLKRLLADSPHFAELWHQHDVRPPENLTKEIVTSEVGVLRLRFTHLWFGQRSETAMISYTPADDETDAKLRRLHELA